jgi:hypothetical protein
MLWISLPFLTQEGLQSTFSFTMQVLISEHCFHFSLRTPHMHESFPKKFSLLNPKTFHILSNQDIFPSTKYLVFYLVLLENYFWALLKHFPHPRKNTACTSAPNLKSFIWTYYSFKVIPNLRCIILLLMNNILANIHVNFISPPLQKLNKISTWISFFALKRNAKQFECAFGFPFFNVVADKKREILTKFMILIWKGENFP